MPHSAQVGVLTHHLPVLRWTRFPYRFRTETTKIRLSPLFYGGTAGTRTQDQSLKRALLYQLSYRPICRGAIIAELPPRNTVNEIQRSAWDLENLPRQSRPRAGGRSHILRTPYLKHRPGSKRPSCRNPRQDLCRRG